MCIDQQRITLWSIYISPFYDISYVNESSWTLLIVTKWWLFVLIRWNEPWNATAFSSLVFYCFLLCEILAEVCTICLSIEKSLSLCLFSLSPCCSERVVAAVHTTSHFQNENMLFNPPTKDTTRFDTAIAVLNLALHIKRSMTYLLSWQRIHVLEGIPTQILIWMCKIWD